MTELGIGARESKSQEDVNPDQPDGGPEQQAGSAEAKEPEYRKDGEDNRNFHCFASFGGRTRGSFSAGLSPGPGVAGAGSPAGAGAAAPP